jgi:AcrR family transcriptional regulator
MTSFKPLPAARGEPVRHRILDAAETLLREGKAEFSMRELATGAGVSFATPFNQFGSKAAIMQALSRRRIDTMTARFAEAAHPPATIYRVLLAVDIAVATMVEEPRVNRAVMGWIGTAGPSAGDAMARSSALWALALGDGDDHGDLPQLLALGFRGALSFWTAGELTDEALATHARAMASALLAGFTA